MKKIEQVIDIDFYELQNEVSEFIGEKLSFNNMAKYSGYTKKYFQRCLKKESMKKENAALLMGTLASIICNAEVNTTSSHNINRDGKTVYFPKSDSQLIKFPMIDRHQNYSSIDEKAAQFVGMNIVEFLRFLRIDKELRI